MGNNMEQYTHDQYFLVFINDRELIDMYRKETSKGTFLRRWTSYLSRQFELTRLPQEEIHALRKEINKYLQGPTYSIVLEQLRKTRSQWDGLDDIERLEYFNTIAEGIADERGETRLHRRNINDLVTELNNKYNSVPLATPTPTTKEPTTMNKTYFETIHTVNGTDVKNLGKNDLVDAIKAINKEIAELRELASSVESKAIGNRINELTIQRDEIVKILDAK